MSAIELNEYHLLALQCQSSFKYFVNTFWHCVPGAGNLKWNWHLDVFCDEFEKLVRRVIAGLPKEHDLVFNEPPGTSKSTIFSILGPAWGWSVAPWLRFMSASNSDNLVTDLSSKSRDVIRSELYRRCFPNIEFREAQDAKGYFANTLGGDRFTCTVAGKSPIGFHFHVAIVDDPIDPKRMTSKAEVLTAKEFMTNVLPSRRLDKAVSAMMLVMQRLGVGDPTDVMLEEAKKEGAVKVRHVCLPSDLVKDESGEFIKSDVKPIELAEKYIDGLMDPVRLGPSVIAEAKARGAYYYDTQFRQKPFNKTGGMFKEKYFLKRVPAAPYHAKRVIFWDRAFSNNDDSCRTAGTCMAWDGQNVYVGPVRVGRWHPDERDDQIVGMAQWARDRFGDGEAEPTHLVEVEPAAGEDSFRYLAKKLAGFKVYGEKAKGNKEQRAQPWASQLAAGNVYIVDGENWIGCTISEWIDEHCAFPNAELKDLVDSSAAAFNWLFRKKSAASMPVQARTYKMDKKGGLRIVVMNKSEAAETIIEEKNLVVRIISPTMAVGALGGMKGTSIPPHSQPNCIESVAITFADIDPANHQESWDQPIAPFGKPCEALIAKPVHAKMMWKMLLLSRTNPRHEVIVIADDSDGKRAMSVAMAVCDGMGLDRTTTLARPDQSWQAGKNEPPPNKHIYSVFKKGRWVS